MSEYHSKNSKTKDQKPKTCGNYEFSMKKQTAKLGVLDWGIGGISLVKLLGERGRSFPLLYFSDTGALPYGRMPRVELISRLNSVVEFLKSKGATHVVIGCNAASTAIDFLDSTD